MSNINPNQINNYKYNKTQQTGFEGLDKQQLKQTAAAPTNMGNDMMWEMMGAGDIDPAKRPAFVAGALMTGGLVGTGYGKISDSFVLNKTKNGLTKAENINKWLGNKHLQGVSDWITNATKSKNPDGFRSQIFNAFSHPDRPMVYRNKLSMMLRNSAVLNTEKGLSNNLIGEYEKGLKDSLTLELKGLLNSPKDLMDEATKKIKTVEIEKKLEKEVKKLADLKVDLKYGKINAKEAVLKAEKIVKNNVGEITLKSIKQGKAAKLLINKTVLLKDSGKNIFSKALTKFMLLLDKPLAIRPTGSTMKKVSMVLGIGSFMSAIFIGAPILSGLVNKKGDKTNEKGQAVDEKGKEINSAGNKIKRSTNKFAEEFIGFWVFFEPSIRSIYRFTSLKNIDPSNAKGLKKFGLKLVKGVGSIFGMGMNDKIAKDVKLKELHILKDKKIGTEITGTGAKKTIKQIKNFLFGDATKIGKAIKARKRELISGKVVKTGINKGKILSKGMKFTEKLGMKWGGRAGFVVRNIAIVAVLQPFFSNGCKKVAQVLFGKPAKAKTEEEKEKKAKEQQLETPVIAKDLKKVAKGKEAVNPMTQQYIEKMKKAQTVKSNKTVTSTKTVTPMMQQYIEKMKKSQTISAKLIKKESVVKKEEEKKVDNYTFIPATTPVNVQQKQASKTLLNKINNADKMIKFAEKITEKL